jgi:hypothetical protein
MKSTNKINIADIIEWDVFNWSRALDFWQTNSKLNCHNITALELGARKGGLSLWLSEFCQTVYCSDLTDTERHAKPLQMKYNKQNIIYTDINALTFNEKEKYELIACKSVLGAFNTDNQNKVIENIFDALKNGGEFWMVKNLNSTYLHKLARKYCTNWGYGWTYLNLSKLPTSLNLFKESQYITFGLSAAFGRNNWQRNILGRADKYLFEKLTSNSQHYIIAAVYRKL